MGYGGSMNAPRTDGAPFDLSGSEPFFVVMNAGSGRADAGPLREQIESRLQAAGRRCEIDLVTDPRKLAQAAARAVERAQQAGGVVVAAGGDGTLNAVAHAVLGTGLPFGILPQGTFNYFGRSHSIPADNERALGILLDGRVQPVQVGLVNGRAFLVNASLGLYPILLEDREAFKQRYGRSRLVALASALVTLLRSPRQLSLRLDGPGGETAMRTCTLVVGNNALQLEQLGIDLADDLKQGRLVAMSPRPVGTLALYGLVLRGALARLGEADNVVSFPFRRVTVQRLAPASPRGIKVAIDGEILRLRPPIEFRVAGHHLPLLVPRHPDPADRA